MQNSPRRKITKDGKWLTMEIASILVPERTFSDVETTSKKRAIEKVSNLIASVELGLDAHELYNKLIAREKLGPTAIGNGIAIPHCRIACSSIVGSLFKFSNGIEFGALDDLPVRIMFVLLVPQHEAKDHLNTLAMLARKFESEMYRNGLLEAKDSRELFEMALTDIEEMTQPNVAG